MKQFRLVLGLVLNDFGAHLTLDVNLVPLHLRLDLEVSLKSLCLFVSVLCRMDHTINENA